MFVFERKCLPCPCGSLALLIFSRSLVAWNQPLLGFPILESVCLSDEIPTITCRYIFVDSANPPRTVTFSHKTVTFTNKNIHSQKQQLDSFTHPSFKLWFVSCQTETERHDSHIVVSLRITRQSLSKSLNHEFLIEQKI